MLLEKFESDQSEHFGFILTLISTLHADFDLNVLRVCRYIREISSFGTNSKKDVERITTGFINLLPGISEILGLYSKYKVTLKQKKKT